MGRAKERKLAIQAGHLDPGPDKPVPSYKQFRRSGRMDEYTGRKVKLEFTVTYNSDGTKAAVEQLEDYDIISLLYLWVKIMEGLTSQAIGNNKGINFIKSTYDLFKKEFGMS